MILHIETKVYSLITLLVKYDFVITRSSDSAYELRWGAVWLYWATGESTYLNKVQQMYDSNTPWAYDWDDKDAGVQVSAMFM